MNILVIEDEPASLKLANLVLSSDGHQVIQSHSAEHAMQTVLDTSPEIILLDLALPGMDGYTLTRRLKADPKTRNIPIIAVTSYPDRFPREEALRAGCEAYIVKPIDTRKLSHQVTTIAAQKSKPPN